MLIAILNKKRSSPDSKLFGLPDIFLPARFFDAEDNKKTSHRFSPVTGLLTYKNVLFTYEIIISRNSFGSIVKRNVNS